MYVRQLGGTSGVVPLLAWVPAVRGATSCGLVRLSPSAPPRVDFRRCIFAYAGLVRGGGGIASAWPRPYHAAIGGDCSPTADRVSPVAFHHDPPFDCWVFPARHFLVNLYSVMMVGYRLTPHTGGDIYTYILSYILLVGCAYFFRRFPPPRRLGGGTCRQKLLLPPDDHARHPGWRGRIGPHWHPFARMPPVDAPVHGVPPRTSPRRSHGPPPCQRYFRTSTPRLH